MVDEFIELLDYISHQCNRYLASIIFIFGLVGNILNCFVLSQRRLRINQCALIFLISSFFNLISILVGLTTRILSGWQIDPTTTNNSICKFRAFVTFSTRTIAIWLIALAAIDRWLLSSINIHRRQMSNLKNTQRSVIIIIIISLVCYGQMLYCYEANINDAPLKCYGITQVCCLVTELIYTFITIIIPLIIMIIFGLMTISNFHHAHIRVQHIQLNLNTSHYNERKSAQSKKTDRHLLRMLLVQIICLTILFIPQAFQKFYISFRPFGSVSKREDALNYFLYNIEILLSFMASGIPFYLYTLSGGIIFQQATINFIKTIHKKFTDFLFLSFHNL